MAAMNLYPRQLPAVLQPPLNSHINTRSYRA